MPPKTRNKQEELTAYNRPRTEWQSFFLQLSKKEQRFVFGNDSRMDMFEKAFDVDDLGKELSERKFDANLPLELLKLDAMVVSVVDWYPAYFIGENTRITPAVQARRDLIRCFVTPMCDLFTQLHSAGDHEDLQVLLLNAMVSLAWYNIEKVVGDQLFAIAEPILLNIHGNSTAILAKIFEMMSELCGSCLRPEVYLLVMKNETMLLSSFKAMASAPPEQVAQQEEEGHHHRGERKHSGAPDSSTAQQMFDEFASFLHTFAETCLTVKARPPALVNQMFPLLATLVEIAPEKTKVDTMHLIESNISEEHYDCWLSLPHLKSAIQAALDFDQWDVDDELLKKRELVTVAMYSVNRFMEYASSDEAALGVGNELSNGRLVEVCQKVLVCFDSPEVVVCFDSPTLWTATTILSRLMSMNSVSLTDYGLLPALMASIHKFPRETCAAALLCKLAPMENVDAIEYLLSCGFLSLITRCLQGGLIRMEQLEWALSFLEEAIDAYGDEYYEGESTFPSWRSLDLAVPYQFPFMLFLKEQHPDVIDGLKRVVETYLAGAQEQFHERAQALLEDIGDIV